MLSSSVGPNVVFEFLESYMYIYIYIYIPLYYPLQALDRDKRRHCCFLMSFLETQYKWAHNIYRWCLIIGYSSAQHTHVSPMAPFFQTYKHRISCMCFFKYNNETYHIGEHTSNVQTQKNVSKICVTILVFSLWCCCRATYESTLHCKKFISADYNAKLW